MRSMFISNNQRDMCECGPRLGKIEKKKKKIDKIDSNRERLFHIREIPKHPYE